LNTYVDTWLQEKCSKCERKEKCESELYIMEILPCNLNYVNRKRKEEVENVAISKIG